MAPSRVAKRQPNLHAFGKVSKTASNAASVYLKLNQKPISKTLQHPLVQIENEEQLRSTTTTKRKRDDEDEGQDECNENRVAPRPIPRKKLRTATDLPDHLKELRDIHRSFLTAFSIHLAHNGAAAPAELDTLLQSITRIWKKRLLTMHDLQRLLTIYEINDLPQSESEVTHNKSPFKLIISGVGTLARRTVEYVDPNPLNEHEQHCTFEHALHRLSFTINALTDLPLLAFATGTQTHVRQQKATALRTHILNKQTPTTSPDFAALSIKDDSTSTVPSSTKSRTLSLFDRVKAKQSLLSTTSTPTSQQILRKHAIGRVAEVVEILRMKQQQQRQQRPSQTIAGNGNAGGKVSFSMKQIVYEVKGSMQVPMGDEEVRLCLEMLARDVPGGWVKVWEVGDVKGIVLEGRGMGGVEVKRILEGVK